MIYTITVTVRVEAKTPYEAIDSFKNSPSWDWDTITIIKHEDE